MNKNFSLASKFLLIMGVLALVISGLLGSRIVHHLHKRPPITIRQTDLSTLREWMTLEYVARTYAIPLPLLEEELQLEPGKFHSSSLSQIANYQNVTSTDLIDRIAKIINQFQSTHSPPPPQ